MGYTEKFASRILLVDDDSDIVELLEYNLVKEGYEVLGMTDPLQVMKEIEHFGPQMLVLDIMMPGIDGLQLCLAIRNTPQGKDLPIFFITMGEEKLSRIALESGGDDFIQKFSGLRTLINRINLVMKRQLTIRKRISTISIGKWRLNRENLSVLSQHTEFRLSDFEFDLLFFLAQNARRSIPIKFLNSVTNGTDIYYRRNSIIQSLRTIAKKIGEGLIVLSDNHRVRLEV